MSLISLERVGLSRASGAVKPVPSVSEILESISRGEGAGGKKPSKDVVQKAKDIRDTSSFNRTTQSSS